MNRYPLTITYRDGTAVQAQADQYAIGVWERWAAKAGLKPDINDPARFAHTQLRVMAWAEAQRDAKAKQTFEAWDTTVTSVDPGEQVETVDPTPAGHIGRVIAMLAVRTGISPRELWGSDPMDLATLVDVLMEQAAPKRRRGVRRG